MCYVLNTRDGDHKVGKGLDGLIRAAGGVISRRRPDGSVEVLLIYRDRQQGNWTFPKGKLEAGETDELCALREVFEETGLICELGVELPPVSYPDRKGRMKLIRYWAMKVLKGEAKSMRPFLPAKLDFCEYVFTIFRNKSHRSFSRAVYLKREMKMWV